MEQSIKKDEQLEILIKQILNPFTSCEKSSDLLSILKNSSSFNGKNHLVLVHCYLYETNSFFYIDEEEAIRQANMAFDEGNILSCFYLYLLLKDKEEVKSRNYLRLSVDSGYPQAYLEMAKCYHNGTLFVRDLERAEKYYWKAAKSGLKEGYFGLLLIACQNGDIQKERNIYTLALNSGCRLVGVVE